MFDHAAILMGVYASMSAGMSVAVAKVSPSIGPRLRHLFAGTAPLALVLAVRMGGADSVTLQGMDLFATGGLAALGMATSSVMGKFVPTQSVAQSN